MNRPGTNRSSKVKHFLRKFKISKISIFFYKIDGKCCLCTKCDTSKINIATPTNTYHFLNNKITHRKTRKPISITISTKCNEWGHEKKESDTGSNK